MKSRIIGYARNLRAALAIHRNASAATISCGLEWYSKQAEELYSSVGSMEGTRTAVLESAALLSPATSWTVLLERFPEFVRSALEGDPCPGFPTYPQFRKGAARILASGARLADLCDGPKVNAFAENLLSGGVSNRVTVDRHVLSLARGIPIGTPQNCTLAEYREIELAVRSLAWELPELVPGSASFGTVAPAQVQSLLWVLNVGPTGRYS